MLKIWIDTWVAILAPAIDRADARRVELQFSDQRKPWKQLSVSQKLARTISDDAQSFGAGPLDKSRG